MVLKVFKSSCTQAEKNKQENKQIKFSCREGLTPNWTELILLNLNWKFNSNSPYVCTSEFPHSREKASH